MKKEDLLKIEGITETLAETIAKQSADELGGYVPKSRFDEVNEAKKNAESLVKERDKQLEDVKKSTGSNEELKKQIEDLQTANKTAKAEYETKIKQIQLDNAVSKALSDSGAKNEKAVKALLSDLDKAELAEDGTVKGLAEQIAKLQSSDDSSFLFNAKSEAGKPSGMTPAASGSNQPPAGKKIEEMTYEEFAAYTANHPEVLEN